MRKIAITLCLLLASAAALADTYSFGQRVLVTGDSVGKVMDIAGKPNRIVQLENDQGAAIGERWEYYRGGKTILINIHGGKVTSISESS